MTTIFTIKRLWASITMVLAVAFSMNMNAQTNLPWHVVVSDNGKEVASHSVEIITDLQVTSQYVTFVLDDGKTFPYPTATSTFTFEQRVGNGTAIEVVAASKWDVYYTGNSLHFTELVNSVAVYTVSGILVAKVSGNYTDVPVNLAKGIYIVQAGGKTVKLLVSNNGSGAVCAQPTVAEIAPASYAPSTSFPVTLKAANTAALKQYWNVHYNNTVIAVEIAQVSSFYFTTDNAVVFTLVNGSTVQLPNYQMIDFGTQPAQSGSKWNMNMTMKFGGAARGVDTSLPDGQWYTPQYVTAFTAIEIICYDVNNQVIRKYPINFIPNYDARFAMDDGSPAYSYPYILEGMNIIRFASIEDGSVVGSTTAKNFGGSNLIQTTFSIDANDNLKVSFNGGEYTFK